MIEPLVPVASEGVETAKAPVSSPAAVTYALELMTAHAVASPQAFDVVKFVEKFPEAESGVKVPIVSHSPSFHLTRTYVTPPPMTERLPESVISRWVDVTVAAFRNEAPSVVTEAGSVANDVPASSTATTCQR